LIEHSIKDDCIPQAELIKTLIIIQVNRLFFAQVSYNPELGLDKIIPPRNSVIFFLLNRSEIADEDE